MLAQLQGRLAAADRLDWERWGIDGTSVRAHKAAAGAGGQPCRRDEPADHALGRSRSGCVSKLHLVCDGRGVPLAVELSAGRRNECEFAAPVLDAVRVPRRLGRLRRRPGALAGDKGYRFRALRAGLRLRDVRAGIPERADQVAHRAHRPGRTPALDRAAYRRRNAV